MPSVPSNEASLENTHQHQDQCVGAVQCSVIQMQLSPVSIVSQFREDNLLKIVY